MNRFVDDIAWPRGDTKCVLEHFSNTNEVKNHLISLAAEGTSYHVIIATVIFSLTGYMLPLESSPVISYAFRQ